MLKNLHRPEPGNSGADKGRKQTALPRGGAVPVL